MSSSTTPSDAQILSALLKATSKEAVVKFFNTCFRYRHNPSGAIITPGVTELGLDSQTAGQLVEVAVTLISQVLYEVAEIASAKQIESLLPSGLDSRLQGLISTVIFAALPSWREAAIDNRVSLPRFEGLSWRVDVVNATSSVQATNEPLVAMQIQTRTLPTHVQNMGYNQTIGINMNAAALGALVDGMRRIKDQLATLQ